MGGTNKELDEKARRESQVAGVILFAVLTTISALTCLFSMGLIVGAKSEMKVLFEEYHEERKKEKRVKQAKWCDEEGVEHLVRTEPRAGETDAEWCERHQALVEDAKKTWPPVVK